MQYMTIQKKSQNLKNGRLISLYNNVPFIFECFHDEQHPVVLKGIAKLLNQKVTRWPKCFSFFFLLSSSSDGLVQVCVTLSRWFSHKTVEFFTEQCTGPSLFSRFEVLRGDSNRSLKNYGFLCDAIFSSRVRMCTNHLATKFNCYVRLRN